MSRISAQRLRRIRNDIPIDNVIQYQLDIPAKFREGFFRFVCPGCGEFNTATNPKTNLARCFTCSRNFNTIELVMLVKQIDFLQAVRLLENNLQLLHRQIDADLHRR